MIEKIKNKIKFPVIIYIAVILGSTLLYFSNYMEKVRDIEKWYGIKVVSILFIIAIVTVVITTNILKKSDNKSIHKRYFISAILLGTVYALIIPMFAQSDEPTHFLRVYNLATGHYTIQQEKDTLATFGFYPKSLDKTIKHGMVTARENKKYRDVKGTYNLKLDKKNTTKIYRIAPYSLTSYIPYVIGVGLGIIFNLSPYIIGILGRICGLVICSLIVSLGIKIVPNRKKFYAILFLTPVALSYMAGITADSVTFSICFLFIAYISYLIDKNKELTRKQKLILILLSIIIYLCKTVYFPVVFIVLLLPKKLLKDNKGKILFVLSCIVVPILVIVLKNLLFKIIGIYTPVAENFDIAWIIKHPLSYGIICLRFIMNNSVEVIYNLIGYNFLANGQASIYSIIPLTYVFILIYSFLSEKVNIKYQNKNLEILLIVSIMIFVTGAIITAMYLGNTVGTRYLGYPYVIGVQGRYLLPIVPLIGFISNSKVFSDNKNYSIIIALLLNLNVMMSLVVTFIA